MRSSSTYSDEDSRRQSTRLSSVGSETSYNYWAPPEIQKSEPSRPQSLSKDEAAEESLRNYEFEQRMSPRSGDHDRDVQGLGLSGFSASSSVNRSKVPPLLSLVVPGPELSIDIGSSLDTPSPRHPNSGDGMSTGSSGKGGWWDVISPTEQSPGGQMPWDRRQSSPGRSPLSPTGSGQELFKGRQSSQSISSALAPPPAPVVIDEATPTSTPPMAADAPMTPQMEARIAQLMNPGMDIEATPRGPSMTEMPRPQVPSATAQEAYARLEGVRLHDESLAKLEGTHKPMPSVDSIALPQPNVPSKQSPQASRPSPQASKPSPPPKAAPPAPAPRSSTPEDDLYARLDFVPMDYNPMHKPAARPTGPIWPNKASDTDRLARSNTQRSPPNPKPNGGAPVWPRRKPSDAHAAMQKDGLPPLSTVNEFGGGGPNSAPLRGSDAAWHDTSEDSRGSLTRSATQGKRPPPVPTTMSRPGFPTPGTGPRKSHEGRRDSGGESAKSKFGAFIGRSMTRRDKENTAGVGAPASTSASSSAAAAAAALAHQQSQRRQPGVANNPGRWNRDMVAGIMGPPAERRQV